MMKRAFCILFSIFLITCTSSFAQKIIALNKTGKIKRIRYYKGDIISLKTKVGEKIYGKIRAIRDSSFVVQEKKIKLSEVKYIRNTKHLKGFKILSEVLFKAGAGYFLIDSGNHLINGEADKVAHASTLKVSALLLGVSFVAHKIANKKYRINNNRSLKIIDLGI